MSKPHNQTPEITGLLNDWKQGNEQASEMLFEMIYPILKRKVSAILAAGGRDLSLQTTDLLHEAFLRMVDQKKADWQDRTHFFAVTAQLVRRIIVDHARHRNRKKRGGEVVKVSLDQDSEGRLDLREDWLALDQALSHLSGKHAQAAKVVELRYFGGLNNEEIAAVLDIGTATVVRHWRFARAWLRQTLKPGPGDETD